MKLARGPALAALLLVALAAPVAAYSLSGDDGGGDEPTAAVARTKPDKPDKPEHMKGPDRADEASAVGRAHAAAMKAWAKCVAEAASGPKADSAPTPPKLACGDKPVGPGRAKHGDRPDGTTPGSSGNHKKSTPRGSSGSGQG